MEKILTRVFYNRSPEIVARELLGKVVTRVIGDQILRGIIVETEAYLSSGDAAAHNFKGQTKRNKSLYGDAGHAYVHSMRQWNLFDIVTEGINIPGSVLIRAVEPVDGIEQMKQFRGTQDITNLTSGPSKFCKAFAITKELDGVDVTDRLSGLYIVDGKDSNEISCSPRIGISNAQDKQLRFCVSGNIYTSR